MPRHIIAVVGHPASGKDTVADRLVEKGFVHINSSDMLRAVMREQGIPTDRPHIHAFVSAQRVKRGNGYLAEEIADVITGDTVVSGFRNTAEVEVFRRRFSGEFTLIAVESSERTRYERIHGRKREGDDLTFEQFQAEEAAEKAKSTGSHEVDKAIALADITLQNDTTKEDLVAKVDAVLKDI